MRKITTLAVVLAAVAAISSSADARTVAPPGNSEADQYYQTLPGSTGPRAPATKRTAEDAVRDGQLSASSEAALRRRGPEGEALVTAVARTAPVGGEGGRSGSPGPGVVPPPDERGLGAVFAPLLAIVAAASIAFFVLRRRRTARQ